MAIGIESGTFGAENMGDSGIRFREESQRLWGEVNATESKGVKLTSVRGKLERYDALVEGVS